MEFRKGRAAQLAKESGRFTTFMRVQAYEIGQRSHS